MDDLPQKFETRLIYEIMASEVVQSVVETTGMPIKSFRVLYKDTFEDRTVYTFLNRGAPFVIEIAELSDGSLVTIRDRPAFPWEIPSLLDREAGQRSLFGTKFHGHSLRAVQPDDLELNVFAYRVGAGADDPKRPDEDVASERCLRFRPWRAPDYNRDIKHAFVTHPSGFCIAHSTRHSGSVCENVRELTLGVGSGTKAISSLKAWGYRINPEIPEPVFGDEDRFRPVIVRRGTANERIIRRRVRKELPPA